MSEELKPNPTQAQTHDAQLAAENMVAGTEKAPQIDFDSDYERAQELSVSDIDRTNAGAQAAAAVSGPERELSQPQEIEYVADPTGDVGEFREMASEVNPRIEANTLSSDASSESGDPGAFLEMAKDVISQ